MLPNPKAEQDLLHGFVYEDWVDQLDYATLEKSAAAALVTACGIARMTCTPNSSWWWTTAISTRVTP